MCGTNSDVRMLAFFMLSIKPNRNFPGGLVVKNLPANADDTGSVSGLGSFPGEGNGGPLQYLAWEIPWTEETGWLQSKRSQKSQTRLSN